jgi:hypothetical protein
MYARTKRTFAPTAFDRLESREVLSAPALHFPTGGFALPALRAPVLSSFASFQNFHPLTGLGFGAGAGAAGPVAFRAPTFSLSPSLSAFRAPTFSAFAGMTSPFGPALSSNFQVLTHSPSFSTSPFVSSTLAALNARTASLMSAMASFDTGKLATNTTGTTITASIPVALPSNVSQSLGAAYQAFVSNQSAPPASQFPLLRFQGNSVGVDVKVTGNFTQAVAQLQSLGMSVTSTSAANDLVEGFLPLSALPTAAQLPQVASVGPNYVARISTTFGSMGGVRFF